MHESTDAVRADIEATRARMSTTIAQLEKKVDVAQKIRDNPWPALAIAFGAGLALSASSAGSATAGAAQRTTSKVASALDDILATTVAGFAVAFQGRIDQAVHGLVASIAGKNGANQVASPPPVRAD
ncbi:MAG: DUF3618 domain-containing protein [Gemmatimonadaceae bacterium]